MLIDGIRDRIKTYLKSIDTSILNYNVTLIIGGEEYILDPQPISSSAVELIEDIDNVLPAKDIIVLELQPAMYYDVLMTFNQDVELTMTIKYKTSVPNPSQPVGVAEDVYTTIQSYSRIRELQTTLITPPAEDVVLKIECAPANQSVEHLEEQLLRLAELLKRKTEIKKQILALIYQANNENLEEQVER